MVAVEPHLIARLSRRIIVWHVLASYLTAAILVGCEWQFLRWSRATSLSPPSSHRVPVSY